MMHTPRWRSTYDDRSYIRSTPMLRLFRAAPRSFRLVAVFGLVLALISAAVPTAQAAVVYPNSMASTGDSITRAYNTGGFFVDAPQNSWSTGTSSTVNSMYLRILARNASIQ